MDLRQFFGTLRRRWIFGVVTFLLGVAATVAVVFSMAPQYGSTAKIFISTPSGGSAEYAASFIVTQRVASYADIAVDPTVLSAAADRLSFPQTGEQLAGHISASVVTSTQTIQLDAKADTPERAQEMVGAVAEELTATVKRLERPINSGESTIDSVTTRTSRSTVARGSTPSPAASENSTNANSPPPASETAMRHAVGRSWRVRRAATQTAKALSIR